MNTTADGDEDEDSEQQEGRARACQASWLAESFMGVALRKFDE